MKRLSRLSWQNLIQWTGRHRNPFLIVVTVILILIMHYSILYFFPLKIFFRLFLPLLDWTCEVRQEKGRECRGDSKGPRLQLNPGCCGKLHGSHSLPGELPVHLVATAWFPAVSTKGEKSEFRLYSKQYHYFFLPQSEHRMLKEKVRNN